MDGNKDDALKCLKIGKDAMESGDRSRALKFLEKARRLDPSLPIDDLVSDLNKQSDEPAATAEDDSPGSAANESSKPPSDRPSLRQRGSSVSSSPGSSSSSSSFTEEQRAIVREIKSKKDYYEILGLGNTCSVEDLRKSYRKLSLKVHPDKNKAPGSEEAFKSVSKAFQCLSNEDTRRKYDVSGSDEPSYHQPRRAARRNNGFYDDEFDADEIFRSFFGGGMNHATTTQFRSFNFGAGTTRTANQASDTGGFNPRVLLQMLPFVFILLLNVLPSSQPIYSLSPSYNYEHKFTTHRGVNYFVGSAKFEQEYPINSQERQRVEEQVDRDYLSILGQNCRLELQRQQWGFVRETPHCDMMRRFDSAAA